MTTESDVNLILRDCLKQQRIDFTLDQDDAAYKEVLKASSRMKTLAIQQAVHHICCKKRALAMKDAGDDRLDPKVEVTLDEIKRSLTRMRDRNDPPFFRKAQAGEQPRA